MQPQNDHAVAPRSAAASTRAAARLRRGLTGDEGALASLVDLEPVDERDALDTLLTIHALHTAPLRDLGGTEWFQHHPAIAMLKIRLERDLVTRLDAQAATLDVADAPMASMRRIAALDLVPPVYQWVAERASLDELVEFVAIEGGPDGGFDDLVAIAQVGIDGQAKVTLGANYWDEMGRGTLDEVHTELHRRLSRALDLPRLSNDELPLEALSRSSLNGVLATNRALQPEMIGALGILELQAGPRCRKVVQALRRLDAPADALPFYEEHARTDPRHGKEWLDEGVAPLIEAEPEWGARIVRGAKWRSCVNRDLFTALERRFVRS